jgi:hypothetical protein
MNKIVLTIMALISCSAAADWAPPPKDAKLSSDLVAMEEQQWSRSGAPRQTPAQSPGPKIAIDAAASGDPESLVNDLGTLGAERIAVFGRMVSAEIPEQAIGALRNLSSLHLVRQSHMIANAGSVQSQGDMAIRSDLGRTAFGIDGSGVTVGVISTSYNCNRGAADIVASGDLPRDILILQEGDCSGRPDEGQAMMELIHDVAPGANHLFYAPFGQADFAQAIIKLADAGC